MPRSNVRMRPSNHLIHRNLIRIKPLPVPPILLGKLKLLIRSFFPLLKPLQLLLRRNLQPKLQYLRMRPAQLTLKLIDLPIRTLPLLRIRKSLHSFHQNPPIPRPVINRHLPPPRNLHPKPPQIMMRMLQSRRSCRLNHPVQPRIHAPG